MKIHQNDEQFRISPDEKSCSAALSYLFSSDVPIITASGKGHIAKRINEIAIENGIEIICDPLLAHILTEQEIGACIPPHTYQAIAAIFAFLKQTSIGKR